jgi:ubiquinone/menaquinone biosynthesis C-methylase UbiE
MLEARVQQGGVADLYRKIAPVYDLWARLTESRARDRCLELARIRDGEAVLEVAVGTGLAFERILRANPAGRNEGIDLTDAMLERARRRAAATGATQYRLRPGDARALDFGEAEFDVLVNNYLFDLLPEADFATVLREFRRVLRPGGRLVVVNMTRGRRWYHGVWERIYRINPAWLGGCRGVEVAPAMAASGFARIRREELSQMTFPSEIVYGEAA